MMVIKDFENKSKTGGTVLSVKKDHEKEAIHLEDLIRGSTTNCMRRESIRFHKSYRIKRFDD